MAHGETATMSLVRRDAQQEDFAYAAGFSITLFRASFFIASSGNAESSRSQRVPAAPRRSKQSKTHDMRPKPLEVMPTILESVPFDITYEDLSPTTRGLQDRVRQQYHAQRSDQASLRRLEVATKAQEDRTAARAALLDRQSLRVLETATARARNARPSRLHDRSSRRPKQSERATRTATLGRVTSSEESKSVEPSSRSNSRGSRSLQSLEAVGSQTGQDITSTTDATAQTTALRIEALSALTSPADSFVRVESSPSTPSSSLFRLPTRPVYQHALETDPGPDAVPVRPTLFQRTMTAFPEIGRLVGVTVPPQTTARTFTRVESGAYSSDNPPSSGRPLRPVGESTSPSWSSEDEAGVVPIFRGAELQERFNETPSKRSMRESRISGWTSEEEALAATRDDLGRADDKSRRSPRSVNEKEAVSSVQGDFAHVEEKQEFHQESPSKVSRQGSIRQPQSPSWSNMEEALGTVEGDFVLVEKVDGSHSEVSSGGSSRPEEALSTTEDDFVHIEKSDDAYSAQSSHSPEQSAQQVRNPSKTSDDQASASADSDLDFAEKQSEHTSPKIGEDDATGSVEDDFSSVGDDEQCRTFDLPPQEPSSPPLKDDDSTIPPAAKTQKWLEDQLADAMRPSTPVTPSKIQSEYADLFSPTVGARAGSESSSISDEVGSGSAHFGVDGEVEEFDDWEDLGDER